MWRGVMRKTQTAGVHGFEPRLKASKASVLPLDDTPKYKEEYTIKTQKIKHIFIKPVAVLMYKIYNQ